jgi:peptidoglycan/xylan/chitin deacetylase (PgdA/CDA1 family)
MAIILAYHRVAHPPSFDPWGLAVHPDRFEEQLSVLRTDFEVLSLDEIVEAIHAQRVPPRGVAITFDDGYLDNLRNAKPRLMAAALPATLFLATGWLGRPHYWWDSLVALFAKAAEDTEHERLLARCFSKEAAISLHEAWAHLRDLPLAEKERTLIEVAHSLNETGAPLDGARPMTMREASEFPNELLSFGAHTVNHPWLPALEANELSWEISESKKVCDFLSTSRTTAFAYPYGAHSEEVVNAIENLGFQIAVTVTKAKVTNQSLPMTLPRLPVRNWTSTEFRNELLRIEVA